MSSFLLWNFAKFSKFFLCLYLSCGILQVVFCCISTHVVFELTFLVLALFNVVLFADVHAIVEYIYSDECVVYFLMYWCCICFVYNDLYLLFCATFCAVFCVDKCGACDVLRLLLFYFLCCIQKVIQVIGCVRGFLLVLTFILPFFLQNHHGYVWRYCVPLITTQHPN